MVREEARVFFGIIWKPISKKIYGVSHHMHLHKFYCWKVLSHTLLWDGLPWRTRTYLAF